MTTTGFSGSPGEKSDLYGVLAGLGLAESLAGRHLLLTGGTGFFGRWLLALLAELNRQGAGIEVTLTSRNPATFLSSHPAYLECKWLNWLPGDIRELRNLSGRPVDLILHAAADTSATAHTRPLELFDTIVEGARRVFDLAVRCDGARVLITGSGAQYGAIPDTVGVPESYPGACMSNSVGSTYGEAKRAQETLGAIYAESYGIDVIMTRCFAFSGYGLPLNGHFAIGNFVRDALYAQEVVLNSNGTAVRSYLHGADLAVWLLALLVRGKAGQAYNVGSDEAITIAELAYRVVARVAPEKVVRIMGRPESSGRSFYVPDITRARALGLDVWTTLDESIDSMVRWAENSKRT
ncbi:NAD-dependent epimerase/dehydratase family protein [Ectopseudomonas mendocina]|uniref:NAD-dependent epimerase/dehydratase family protein n=1 Tax=Ectopseudomonas mendocina TaxID=300 RepID=UPI0004DC1939|nr:NAD(P)-dependent oxidoreductase [Pseudomonas mendocina]